MSKYKSLGDLEKKVFSLNYADGFIDMIAAAIFMQFALFTLISRLGNDELWAYMLMSGVFFLCFGGSFLIRKYVTEPRLGYVQFKKERKRRIGVLFILSTVLLVAGILLSIFMPQGSWLLSVLSNSMTLLVIYIGTAFALNISRIYFYGILAAIAMPIGKWMDIITSNKYAMPITMIIFGLFMIVSAIIVFIRFIKKYPLRGAGE